MDFANLFLKFGGRINRAKYWLATLIYLVVSLVVAAADYWSEFGMAFHAAASMVNIVIYISSLAVGVKRLHDRNKSGWYLLLFYIAPSLLFAVSFGITVSDGSGTVAGFLALAGVAIVIWTFVELGCLRGTIGANAYGPDPIAPDVLTPPVRTHA